MKTARDLIFILLDKSVNRFDVVILRRQSISRRRLRHARRIGQPSVATPEPALIKNESP
jgi:hypothetical protein